MQINDNEVARLIAWEETRQNEGIELIASENYQSHDVLAVQASVFANKYAEWYPWKRYYGWQEFTDQLESLAIQRAKNIFHADHANVQALSWAAANICFYTACMKPWDNILWLDMWHWGHLTHWAPVTFISKVFNFFWYGTDKDWKIDFNQVRALAHEHKPKVILAGFSAYPRELEYEKFVEIAKEVWAIAYADVSHIGWFIAAGLLKNPLDCGFHAMMTTTHKSFRWPRGAIILSKWTVSNPLKAPEETIENLPTRIDRAVFPGMQWGPHMNTIAWITVALKEAETESYKNYAKQALVNAQILAEEFLSLGYSLVTWGTDNHMIVLDFSENDFDGNDVEKVLDQIGISVSKSLIPNDKRPAFKPSWVRIWTPAMTTRGCKEEEMKKIVHFIDQGIKNRNDENELLKLREEVRNFWLKFRII